MPFSPEQTRLLYKIARDYYEADYTQDQIAGKFGLSRIKVSRLLKQARKQNIVRITLHPPVDLQVDLEHHIETAYGLEEVKIVECDNYRDQTAVANALAPAGAECLVRRLAGDEIVGVTWGKTVKAVISSLPPLNLRKAKIVQMTGGLGSIVTLDHATELARQMAGKLSAELHLLPAPGIAKDAESAGVFKKDNMISNVLRLAATAKIALVGIGILSNDTFLLQDSALLSENDQNEIERAGAVGDVALRYMTGEGNPCNLSINNRIVGLSFEELLEIPHVIAVAGGVQKISAIRAALLSGIINILVTDKNTAKALL